ncbi:MAG: TIGR03545 family protein [Deltaproteobacteria bacterium]|nr:MAG: TIGR03545 family protein [Deltaproteobacteria bacterium]
MVKYIRWKGCAAFLIVIIILGGFWLLFVDSIVKGSIEKYGTRAVGATVNVAKADLSLLPAGLTLDGLQITNPDKPMTNAVEISRINMAIDSVQLLRRKIIINDMSMEGVRFDTARKKSGAVKKSAGPARSQKGASKSISKPFSLPSFEIPSVSDILQKEELNSLTLIASFQNDLQTEKKKWRQLLKELPDKEKFEGYKSRIEKIKSSKKGKLGGFLESAGEAASIQKEIKKDIEKIKTAVDDVEKQLLTFKNRFNQISKSPLEDIQRLKNKYSISPKGLANMSRLLFSEKISNWLDKAMAWYDRLQPMLQRSHEGKKGPEKIKPLRGKGVNVRFKEYRPLPDFLIHNVKTNLVLTAGDVTGIIKNITPDQDILGLPLIFAFSGENMQKIGSLRLDGKSDYVIPSRAKNSINLSVKKLTISNLVLSEDTKFPVSLKKAVADVDMQAALSGNNINSNINAAFNGVKLFSDPADSQAFMAKAMSSALSGINQFKATLNIEGTTENYDVKINSDIDRVLKRAVGNIARKESAQFEQKLKTAIFAKVNGPLNDAKESLGGFGSIADELNGRLGSGKGLMGGELKLPF